MHLQTAFFFFGGGGCFYKRLKDSLENEDDIIISNNIQMCRIRAFTLYRYLCRTATGTCTSLTKQNKKFIYFPSIRLISSEDEQNICQSALLKEIIHNFCLLYKSWFLLHISCLPEKEYTLYMVYPLVFLECNNQSMYMKKTNVCWEFIQAAKHLFVVAVL